jgi:ABC-type branched-subunit amino acid transport system substrate-binding protein
VAADYSFGHTNFLGFALDFCQAGGEIVERFWAPLGSQDFASVIAALPDDVDAIHLGFGGGDAINFLNQYQQVGGDANLIGGTITADASVLSAQGRAKEALLGTPTSGPQATDYDGEAWQAFVKRDLAAFPENERFPVPSLFATGYYNATNAALKALEQIGGDLSDGHAKFHAALASLTLEAPNGTITLDGNRQAIGTNYVPEVKENADGSMFVGYAGKAEGVSQTLGLTPEQFAAMGLPSRTNPECVRR